MTRIILKNKNHVQGKKSCLVKTKKGKTRQNKTKHPVTTLGNHTKKKQQQQQQQKTVSLCASCIWVFLSFSHHISPSKFSLNLGEEIFFVSLGRKYLSLTIYFPSSSLNQTNSKGYVYC